MDPEATTQADLENADVRIVYNNRDIGVVELMTWRRMVSPIFSRAFFDGSTVATADRICTRLERAQSPLFGQVLEGRH